MGKTAMAAGGELQLLGAWFSPYVIRVQIALAMKGLSSSYEYIEQDLFNKSDLLLRSNPAKKKVPVLIHDGRPVCESLVIVQYVDEVWAGTGRRILAADAHDRAVARFWAAYIDDKFYYYWGALYRALPDQRADAFKDLVPHMAALEQAFRECSRGKAFFGGDAIGLVDLALGSFLVWIRVVDEATNTNLLDEAKFPGLAAWEKRFMDVDVVKETMPDSGRFMEYYKGFQASLLAGGS